MNARKNKYIKYILSMSKGMFFDKYGQHGGILFDTSTYSSMSSTYATWPIHVAIKVCTFLQIKWM
jgi:hypothetical protein